MMKKAKKYRTHYQRACIYATLPVTDEQSYNYSEVTVPILLCTNGTETSMVAAYLKMSDYYLRTITPSKAGDNLRRRFSQNKALTISSAEAVMKRRARFVRYLRRRGRCSRRCWGGSTGRNASRSSPFSSSNYTMMR